MPKFQKANRRPVALKYVDLGTVFIRHPFHIGDIVSGSEESVRVCARPPVGSSGNSVVQQENGRTTPAHPDHSETASHAETRPVSLRTPSGLAMSVYSVV